MPFIFPGSSEQLMTAEPPPEQPAEVLDKLAALSVDEPLPESYPTDTIRLLVQSPYRAFVYWNHARDPFETLRRAFGVQDASRYKTLLRLTDLDSGEEHDVEASPLARNYWFNVRPGRRYRAAVGLGSPGRPFIRLLSSAPVSTPRVTVSHLLDDSPKFRAPAAEFARVLNEAGYASDALEVTLEAVDEATRDETTRRLTREVIGAEVPAADPEWMNELRAMLAALTFGVPLDSLLSLLSPELAEWLRRVLAGHEDRLSAERLLAALREALSLELEYDPRYDAATHDEQRRPARMVWGGSDVQMPPVLPGGIPHLRMPSFSGEGLVSRLARWRQKTEARG